MHGRGRLLTKVVFVFRFWFGLGSEQFSSVQYCNHMFGLDFNHWIIFFLRSLYYEGEGIGFRHVASTL